MPYALPGALCREAREELGHQEMVTLVQAVEMVAWPKVVAAKKL